MFSLEMLDYMSVWLVSSNMCLHLIFEQIKFSNWIFPSFNFYSMCRWRNIHQYPFLYSSTLLVSHACSKFFYFSPILLKSNFVHLLFSSVHANLFYRWIIWIFFLILFISFLPCMTSELVKRITWKKMHATIKRIYLQRPVRKSVDRQKNI